MAKNRDYNRVSQDWECGWAKDGKSCPKGPSSDGKCHTTTACAPAKDGDRFLCSRVATHGGRCEKGPLPDGTCGIAIPPCVPNRTLRAKRKLVSFLVLAASLGVLLIAFGVPAGSKHFLSPGQLSAHHSSIKQDCASCHGGSSNLPLQWLSKGRDPHATSQNCVSCHAMGENSFAMHGMKPEDLEALHKGKVKDQRGPASASAKSVAQLECATCHKEHRGIDAKISEISNQKCQSCHVQQFSSFSKNHPEFKQYPFTRRTRILFDHNSHFGKYFGEKDRAEISCNQCHSPEQGGSRMNLKGFQASCIDCHDSAIRGVEQTTKGVAFWRFPTLDLKALQKAGLNIGSWPEDSDGKLTPFQRILLAGDETFSKSLEDVGDLDLADLDAATPEQKKAAAKLAWGVKAILNGISTEGSAYVKERLERALERKLSAPELAELMGGLPIEVLRSAQAVWFKNLAGELATFKAGRPQVTQKIPSKKMGDEGDESWSETGGWYRNSADFSLKFRPRGHADPFMKSWINLLASEVKRAPVVAKSFDALTDAKAPGGCIKCHSVDQKADGSMVVNWHGKSTQNQSPGFQRFSHSAHFNLLNEKGCVTCHEINPKAEYEKNYEGKDPLVFTTGFSPISKATCVACHGNDRVGDSCQSCHNYHVEGDRRKLLDFEKVKTKF